MPSVANHDLRRGWFLLASVGGIAGFFLLSLATYRDFIPDDLYIYLRFARNLLHDGSLAFNPGEPTYGFTSVLWLGLIALAGALHGNLEVGARLLSAVVAATALVSMGRLALRLSGSMAVAWAAPILLGLDLWFLRWAATGMESPLAVALLLGGFTRHLEESRAGKGRAGSTLWFALLALVRPEALGLLVLALVEAGVPMPPVPGARPAPGWRRFAGACAVAAAIVGPWLLYAYLEFGVIVPDTAPAKGIPGAALARAGASLFRIGMLGGPTVMIPGLLLVAGAVAWWASGERGRREAVRPYLLLAAWMVALPLLYAATGVTVYSRYLLLWTPLVSVCGLTAGRWLLGRWGGAGRAAWGALVVLTAAGNVVLTHALVAPASRDYARSMERVNVVLGRWLGDNTPAGTVIACENIGAIGYFSDRRILDMNGLVTPEVIPYKRRGRVEEFLERHPPDYVIKIAPEPDPWAEDGPRLALERLQVLPFHHMFIPQRGALYYTLYRVRAGSPEADPPGGAESVVR